MLAPAFCVVAALVAAAAAAPEATVDLGAPAELLTNTTFVEDVAVGDDTIWVATRGGIEVYDRATLVRRRVLTTRQGLATNHVRHLELDGDALLARSERTVCQLAGAASGGGDAPGGAQFACRDEAPLPLDEPAAAPVLEGARVTITRALPGAGELVGTAGRGLWLRRDGGLRALTADGQICSNHIFEIQKSTN